MRPRIAFIFPTIHSMQILKDCSPRAEATRTVPLCLIAQFCKLSLTLPMQLEGIDHVAIGVRDIERSVKWYIEVLGFERLHEGAWEGVPTFIGRGNTGIALFPASHEAKSSGHREIRMLHLAFRTDHENFLNAQRELKKRGIKFEFQDHEIAHSIYFRDPDGHQLEITTYEVEGRV